MSGRKGRTVPTDPPAAALTIAPETLRPLVREILAETLAQLERDRQQIPEGPLAYDEPTAARLLAMGPHQLRDERLRGRIAACKVVGGRIRYQREDLLTYLRERRIGA